MNTNTTTGSELVQALEQVWAAIRERHPELPDVVIITGSGFQGGASKWGHYGHQMWLNGRFIVDSDGNAERDRKPELFIAGERLGVGAAETVQTMLHEAVHALAAIRGVKDTSRQNRYHNKKFLEISHEVGLNYLEDKPDTTIGYSAVVLTDGTREEYAEVIDHLSEAIQLTMELPGWFVFTGGVGPLTRRGKATSPKRATGMLKAECECGRIIRVARTTFDLAGIECRECETLFEIHG